MQMGKKVKKTYMQKIPNSIKTQSKNEPAWVSPTAPFLQKDFTNSKKLITRKKKEERRKKKITSDQLIIYVNIRVGVTYVAICFGDLKSSLFKKKNGYMVTREPLVTCRTSACSFSQSSVLRVFT